MTLTESRAQVHFAFMTGVWLFTASFFLAQDAKAQRAIFIILMLIPFLLNFKKTHFFALTKTSFLPVYAYFTLLLASVLWSVNFDQETRPDKIFINTFSTLFFFIIFYSYFKNNGFTTFIKIFCFCGILSALYSLPAFYATASFPNERLHSMLRDLHPNITGSYYSLTCVFLIYLSSQIPEKQFVHKITFAFFCTLLVLCVVLTQSRGSMLILFSGISTLLLLNKPKLLFLFFLVGTLSMIGYWLFEPAVVEQFFTRGSSGRGVIRDKLLERASGNIIFGQGIASRESVSFAGHAHSSYLSTYLKLGLVGLGLHICILINAFYFAYKVFEVKRNWLPLTWLVMGSTNLLVEGTELVRPYHIEWVQFWLPVALCFATYHSLQAGKEMSSS